MSGFLFGVCVRVSGGSDSITDCLLTLNRTNPRHNINKLHSYTRTNIISLARFFPLLLLIWDGHVVVVFVGVAAVAIAAGIFVVVATHPFIDYFHVCNLL